MKQVFKSTVIPVRLLIERKKLDPVSIACCCICNPQPYFQAVGILVIIQSIIFGPGSIVRKNLYSVKVLFIRVSEKAIYVHIYFIFSIAIEPEMLRLVFY